MKFKALFHFLFCGASSEPHDLTSSSERRPLVMRSHDQQREAEVCDLFAHTYAGNTRGERRAQASGKATSNPPKSQNVAQPNVTNSSRSGEGNNSNNNNRSRTVRYGTSSHTQPSYTPLWSTPESSSCRPRMTTTDTLNKNKPLPPIPEPLDRTTLLETLDTFHRSLSHIRYAVSGLAALAVWGYTSRLPTRVTIMCCSSDKQVIRTWAKVSGWCIYPNQPDVIGLPSGSSGKGKGIIIIRQIRLRGITNEETFEWQGRVCPADETHDHFGDIVPTKAMVLTPTALLNQFCQNYSLSIERSTVEVAPYSTNPDLPRPTRAEYLQQAVETAELIFWILKRMVKGKRQAWSGVMTPPSGEFLSLIPHVLDRRLRTAFTENYPRSITLFTQCGFGSIQLPREAGRDSGTRVNSKRHGSIFHPDDLLRPQTAASSSRDTFKSVNTNTMPSDTDDTSLFDVSAVLPNGNGEEEEDILATQWRIPEDLRKMMEKAALEYQAKEFWR